MYQGRASLACNQTRVRSIPTVSTSARPAGIPSRAAVVSIHAPADGRLPPRTAPDTSLASGGEHDPEPGLATQHAVVGLGRPLERVRLVQRPYPGLHAERQ